MNTFCTTVYGSGAPYKCLGSTTKNAGLDHPGRSLYHYQIQKKKCCLSFSMFFFFHSTTTTSHIFVHFNEDIDRIQRFYCCAGRLQKYSFRFIKNSGSLSKKAFPPSFFK